MIPSPLNKGNSDIREHVFRDGNGTISSTAKSSVPSRTIVGAELRFPMFCVQR